MEALASATGIPEPTLRLLTSVLAAYPIALVQRKLLTPTVSPATRNLFNVVSGVGVAFFFCGRDIVHSWITISATWLICRFAQQFLHPKQWWFAQAFSFVFNCAYLLISYYFTASEEYDINWTTPQSVLTLRLIGFAFDFADGAKFKLAAEKKKKEDGDSGTEQPADQPAAIPAPAPAAAPARRIETEANRAPTAWAGDLAMPTLPSYLETLGFAYYSGSFLVGPQFSFHLYRRYLTLDLFQAHVPVGTTARVPINLPLPAVLASGAGYALSTFGLAVVYLAVTQVLSMFFWSGATQLPEFLNASFAYRVAFGWMAGKTALTKYLGMWLLTEGACVLSGMAFDGMDASGKARWGGLANINVKGYELATSLAQIIASFNINTNHWARLYLFKRLRFLGNKHLSSVGTLTFLAIWHGFHPGYAFAFALEFIDMIVERRLKQSCAGIVNALSVTAVGRALVNVTCWLLTTTALYYAALGFDLLTGKAIITAFNALYWYNHIALPVLFVITLVFPGRRAASGPAAVKKVQ